MLYIAYKKEFSYFMDSIQLLDLAHESVWVMLKLSMPILLVALFVGLIISLLQALTQIQEPTLSFVPKILAVFAIMLFTLSYTGGVLSKYSIEIMSYIASVE